MSGSGPALDGFVRVVAPAADDDDPYLSEVCALLRTELDNATRAQLAQRLSSVLRKRGINYGPAYSAWWSDDSTVMASFLPGWPAGRRHVTAEFRVHADGVRLDATWTSSDPAWGGISREEYESALSSLRLPAAAVSGLSVTHAATVPAREAALVVLARRGVPFGPPVAPHPGPPDPIFEWLPDDSGTPLPSAWAGWDLEPRLVGPEILLLHAIYHAPTGLAVMPYRLQGQWSADALGALRTALDVLLPGRYELRLLRFGVARLTVALGFAYRIAEVWAIDDRPPPPSWVPTLDRCRAVLVRARRRQRGLPTAPPHPSAGLPDPDRSPRHLRSFSTEDER